MADPDFKPRKGKSKKQSAIAVCISSVRGENKMDALKDKQVFRYFETATFDVTNFEKQKNGNVVFKDIDLFKTGTFHNGEVEINLSDLHSLVANFKALRDSGAFVRVPWRIDHPGMFSGGSVKDKVGHIVDARVVEEGENQGRVFVDIEIVDESILPGIKSGKYVDRSLELGSYMDNSGNMYSPTILGAAFVDIPAVENLSAPFKFKKSNNGSEEELQVVVLNEKVKEQVSMKKEDESKEPEAKKEFVAGEDNVEEVDGEENENDEKTDGESGESAGENSDSEENEDGEESEDSEEVQDESAGEGENKEETENVEAKKKTEPAVNGKEAQEGESKDSEDESKESELSKAIAEKNEFRAKALISEFKASGKTVPAMEESELSFLKSLSDEQIEIYKNLKASTPEIVSLDKEKGETVSVKPSDKGGVLESKENSKDTKEKAKGFFERTGGLQGTVFTKE